MTKFLLTFAFLLAALPVFAQDDAPKNVIAIQAVYGRSDVDLKNIKGETRSFDASRDAIGVEFNYTRFLGKSPFGVGMSGGALFHNKDTAGVYPCGAGCTVETRGISKVQKGYAQYEFVVQDRKGSFQPGVAAVAGVDRGNFGGVTFAPTGNFIVSGATRFYYGGKAWVDVKLKGNAYWRTGVQVTKAFNSDTSQVDVQVSTGLAFKFGKK